MTEAAEADAKKWRGVRATSSLSAQRRPVGLLATNSINDGASSRLAIAAAVFGLAQRVTPWVTVVLTLILFTVVYGSGLAQLSRPSDRQ